MNNQYNIHYSVGIIILIRCLNCMRSHVSFKYAEKLLNITLMPIKFFRQCSQRWLLFALLILALGQMVQVLHHADLVAHETGELCQVCLHGSTSALAMTSKAILIAPIWLCVGCLTHSPVSFVRHRFLYSSQPRAPPYYF